LVACGGGGGDGGSATTPAPASPSPAPAAPNPDPTPDQEPNHCAGIGDGNGFFINSTKDLGLCDDENDSSAENVRAPGGMALTDIDNDGRLELYFAPGNMERGRLYSYDGSRFVPALNNRGINPTHMDRGAYFLDLDSDGAKDLVSVQLDAVEVFMNDGSGHFTGPTTTVGLQLDRDTFSMAAADFDQDGDIDLFFSHWGTRWPHNQPSSQYLWQNDGSGNFSDLSRIVQLNPATAEILQSQGQSTDSKEYSFTPTFSDIDLDGDQDLLIASDFGSSQVLRNDDGIAFVDITSTVINDENGMGATVADYDRDGDLDWFVTSIYSDSNLSDASRGAGSTGNRLYQNQLSESGDFAFQDVTETSGVREGGWGWGACFADFDNDGHLDIFHTTSAVVPEEFGVSNEDSSRLFMADGDGSFTERSAEYGLTHIGRGRAVVCTDYNGDGKIDLFVANNGRFPTVYTNNHQNANHYLMIDLAGKGANASAIGAHVTITTATGSQTQELIYGSGYLSQTPQVMHFGLGQDTQVNRIEVRWPGPGHVVSQLDDINVDQRLVLQHPGLPAGSTLNVVEGVGGGRHIENSSVEVQAAAAPDFLVFSHWSSDNGGTFADPDAPSTTFTMPGNDAVVRANYVAPPAVEPERPQSVARRWNEVLLNAIRNDYARPTVHARNLFHISSAMYDAWAVYSDEAEPFLLGNSIDNVAAVSDCPLTSFTMPNDYFLAREEAISFAAYRIIRHRFTDSPGTAEIAARADGLMFGLGYDINNISTEYIGGSAAALGNYIAQCYIDMGYIDGANEVNKYVNQHYAPVNTALEPNLPGNPNITDLNRWQPLSLPAFIDQAGNPVNSAPEFLGPEWGQVTAFALSNDDRTIYSRDGFDYWVFHDPGMPSTIDGSLSDNYKWGFSLVSIWSSHLSPEDGEMVDISPASLGNIQSYPTQFEDYPNFYNTLMGGDGSTGYDSNPITGLPYTPQMVPRGDYARVLAEFWADGPDSETPPGHWFVILNEVNDHPQLQRRFEGIGPELGLLEWDIKVYFSLAGAMHDAAVTAWGIKGWYDYIRPVSSIRAMADLGQNSDTSLASYHIDGIPLEPGYIELIESGDPLSGEADEHVGKIKLLAWRGPDYIADPDIDAAGVDWIRAEDWWPYQRPTFVTPPFAGYVSGHSTYSRAAAEVLTAFTGSQYFPGGMSGFDIPANEFLVFEKGPSVDMTLQWATYQDASDQCSLSRIWGGIHPPIDDIPGRLIGKEIGQDAFSLSESYFNGSVP